MVRLLPPRKATASQRVACFNPTMVRLLLGSVLDRLELLLGFNPTMVRLLRARALRFTVKEFMFQSHNGAIAAVQWSPRNCFGSAVSIPQWCDCCQTYTTTGDISVNVSIPQWCDCCNIRYRQVALNTTRFNPTMVRLLLRCQINDFRNAACFNPTMVRLLLFCQRHSASKRVLFQSHNGAIAAPHALPSENPFRRFNPTMVRLLPSRAFPVNH